MTDDESRKAFEESAGSHWPLDRLADGEYFDYEMQRAWLWWDGAWQAAVKCEKDRIAPLLEECLDVIPCYVPDGPTDDIIARLCAELGIEDEDD